MAGYMWWVGATMEQEQPMTKYTLDCPDALWESWKETVPRSMNLNDGLVQLLAERTLEERGDELDEETRATIEDILDR